MTLSGTTVRVLVDGVLRHSFASTFVPSANEVYASHVNWCHLALYGSVLADATTAAHHDAGV